MQKSKTTPDPSLVGLTLVPTNGGGGFVIKWVRGFRSGEMVARDKGEAVAVVEKILDGALQ